jgi:hypothetical protein
MLFVVELYTTTPVYSVSDPSITCDGDALAVMAGCSHAGKTVKVIVLIRQFAGSRITCDGDALAVIAGYSHAGKTAKVIVLIGQLSGHASATGLLVRMRVVFHSACSSLAISTLSSIRIWSGSHPASSIASWIVKAMAATARSRGSASARVDGLPRG